MSFHKFIQYKALDRMYSTENDFLLESALKNPASGVAEQLEMKNVCAMISKPLFDELEGICGLLSISKRKFIEGALIEAIAQANKIVDEIGLHEHYERLADDQATREVVGVSA